jgi:hypothetical protein
MNITPITGANITQTLFKQNEKLVVPSDSVSLAFQNLSTLSGINSMPEEINNMYSQMPAFINQAHLSTWYQDNPFGTLSYSKKYGLPPMGGNLELNQPSGHKPGNTYSNYLKQSGKSNAQNLPSTMQNMKQSGLIEEFANISFNPIKIHWQ